MISVGYECKERTNAGAGKAFTIIYPKSTVDGNGTLNSWCVYIYSAACSGKIKIFRDDGTNFNFIGESALTTLNVGHNMGLPCNITVLSGDILSIYLTHATNYPYVTVDYELGGSPAGIYSKAGDITSNSLKSSWSHTDTSNSIILSSKATDRIPYYVKTTGDDVLDGLSWANAWTTINKAATTVPDNTLVHIGFGTYNGEPVGNKIAPQNAAADGVEYLCETATTGGGTGSVIIEKN